MTEDLIQKYPLIPIFFPDYFEKQRAVQTKGTRFVHYCGADAAMNILRTKKFWMRNTKCMNDYREIEHGLDCLISAWGDSHESTPIKEALNDIFPGITNEIETLFNCWVPILKYETYISCFSEHKSSEDDIGRLSMWRAYGRSTGVALVMNNEQFFGEDDTFAGVYTVPVAYETNNEIKTRLDDIAKRILNNKELVRQQGKETVLGTVFNLLKICIICTKHLGFEEEKEWRVIYCPKLETNKNLTKNVENVNGAPQLVYKFPLDDIPQDDIKGINLTNMIDRIIIGPSQYPLALCNAFIALLEDAGIDDPESKVFASEIPLRV